MDTSPPGTSRDRILEFSEWLKAQGLLTRVEPVPAAKIEALRTEFPGVPQDYLDFLLLIGWGELGDDWYCIYNSPIEPGDLFHPEDAEDFQGLRFFGRRHSTDDAFDLNDGWKVVEVSEVIYDKRTGLEFVEWVEKKLKWWLDKP